MIQITVYGNVGCYEELLWQENFERKEDCWLAFKDDYSAPKTTNQLDIAGLNYIVEHIDDINELPWDDVDIYFPD